MVLIIEMVQQKKISSNFSKAKKKVLPKFTWQ